MKTPQEWAIRLRSDRKTPWAKLVKMIQDDALELRNGAEACKMSKYTLNVETGYLEKVPDEVEK